MVAWFALLAGCRADGLYAPTVRGFAWRQPTSPIVRFDHGAPRNLLMISIDTLRRDHVDRYATDGVVRMPFLSGLLDEGVAFDELQQCSNWTFHSTSCTLLGRQEEETGWVARLLGTGPTPVPDGQRTLAVRLREAGFHTALASTNGWLSSEWNNAQGYDDELGNASIDALPVITDAVAHLRDRLRAAPAPRWFLHVHLVEPHVTYSPPAAYLAELDGLPPIPWDLDDHDTHYLADDAWPAMTAEEQALLLQHMRVRYDGETRWLDDQLADAFALLDADGWLDDTLVVVWTDHGEAFWEHGEQTHAWGLTAEENDGVAGLWSTGIQPAAWPGPTHAIDLVPTVLDGLGLPVPADDGLAGAIIGTAPDDRPRFTSTVARAGAYAAVTRGGLKLVYGFDGSLVLWDRGADRTENTAIPPEAWVGDTAASVRDLWALLQPRVALLSAAVPDVTPVPPQLP